MHLPDDITLYAFLMGWHTYDQVWRLLVSLGLVALPFAGIALRTVSLPLLSMGGKDAGTIGTRRFIVNLLIALGVLGVAGVPVVYTHVHVRQPGSSFCEQARALRQSDSSLKTLWFGQSANDTIAQAQRKADGFDTASLPTARPDKSAVVCGIRCWPLPTGLPRHLSISSIARRWICAG